jgi:hypothetical protein
MLQNCAMLASLSISRWTARKFDKKVSKEVDVHHGAKDGGRYSKILVDKTHTQALMTSAGAIRAYHYHMTLPWDDEGPRLLPSASFEAYTAKMRELREQDRVLQQAFFKVYPQLVIDAKKRLGSLYSPEDYPPTSEIASKFDIRISMTPVPSANDFRVNISAEAAEQIRAELAAENDARFQAAMKSCYTRLHEVVTHISGTLHKENPRIYDTLVSNARELISCLPALNLSNDPTLEQLRLELDAALPMSADILRGSETTRKAVASDVDAIIEKMKHYV